jgi:Outer membrane protein beta-barrel domain
MQQYNIHIYKNHINLVTGFGLEWNSYAFRNNTTLQANTNQPEAIEEGLDFSKNKLKTTFVRVPLMLEFNTGKTEENNFHVAVGGTIGYNIFRNRVKQVFEVNGDEQKRKIKDDFNVNPFRYGATARIGYNDFTLFANYDLSTFFKENRGPKLNTFSAGFSLNF